MKERCMKVGLTRKDFTREKNKNLKPALPWKKEEDVARLWKRMKTLQPHGKRPTNGMS